MMDVMHDSEEAEAYATAADRMNFLKFSLNVPRGVCAASMFSSTVAAFCDHPRAGRASVKYILSCSS